MSGNVLPLFSRPLGITQVDIDCKKLLQEIKNYQYLPYPQYGFYSKNQQILNKPKLKDLKKSIETAMAYHLYKTLAYDTSFDFYLSNSWVSLHKPGDFAPLHCHKNALYSFVFYLSEVENHGKIQFSDDVDRTSACLDIPRQYNIYNSPNWLIEPKEGMLLIFPADVKHSVEPNTTSSDRYVIAGNYFVRGEFSTPTNKLILK